MIPDLEKAIAELSDGLTETYALIGELDDVLETDPPPGQRAAVLLMRRRLEALRDRQIDALERLRTKLLATLATLDQPDGVP